MAQSQLPKPVDERDWAKRQRQLTDVSTGLTAGGAMALGAMLAGKTKIARKVLPPRIHLKMQSSSADDLRNSIALASMLGGVASGVHWSKKLRSDAEKPPVEVQSQALAKAANYAAAMDIEKSIVTSGLRWTIKGPRVRRAFYRRTPLPTPRLRRGI